MNAEPEHFKTRQRQIWSIGDYSAMAPHLERAAQDLVTRLHPRPGMHVLDIATGTGNAAIAAAHTGAHVTGLDLTPEHFDDAHERSTEVGLDITWSEGDLEALPYPDGFFDQALSSFGMMFAPHPTKAASELVRVLRPGGRFALCNWSLRGSVWAVYSALKDGATALPVDENHPLPWGEADLVSAIFAEQPVELHFQRDAVTWLFPTAEEGVRWLEEVSGPVILARSVLQARGEWAARRARLVEEIGALTRTDIVGVWVQADYLITTGKKLD